MKHMYSEEEIASQKKDIATLVDSKGNPRFIEGYGEATETTGLEITYNKWSLSGTHLMLVLAGSVTNGTTLNGVMTTFKLPNFILEKIYPIANDFIEFKQIVMRASNLGSQNAEFISKKVSNGISIQISSITLNSNKSFRVQFDLLIDTE